MAENDKRMVIFFLECNLQCLMTSDKDFLGKDSIDKFDALLFQIRLFNTDERGNFSVQAIDYLIHGQQGFRHITRLR